MTIESTASAVHKEIREFFEVGVKSLNKVYTGYSEYLAIAKSRPAPVAPDKKHAVLSEKAYLDKQSHRTRGLNSVKKSYWPKIGPALPGKSVAEYGKFLFEEQEKATWRAGNCLEMAAMAIHRVKGSGYGGWLCFVKEGDVDHAFCAVTSGRDARPGWKNIAMMDKDESSVWIIDPWANVCCPAKQYRATLIKKFEKWHYSGKLILTKIVVDKYGQEDLQFKSPADFNYQRDFWTSRLSIEADTFVIRELTD